MASTVTSPTNSARSVAGLMGFAVLFSLIGNEVEIATAQVPTKPGMPGFGVVAPGVKVTSSGQPLNPGGQTAAGLDRAAIIIIGGFVAASLLVALTGAGEGGRKFAVGLAGVTAASSMLVYGGPVWRAISNIVGGTPTGSTTPTANSANTTPTQGAATAVALTNIAG